MRISDWSSDVCSSDLRIFLPFSYRSDPGPRFLRQSRPRTEKTRSRSWKERQRPACRARKALPSFFTKDTCHQPNDMTSYMFILESLQYNHPSARSAEHTSELQSLMRSSYAVFCLTQNHTKNSRSTDHT